MAAYALHIVSLMRTARLDRGLWRANKKAAGRVCALCALIERLCGLAQRQMYCIGVECFARRGFLIEMLECRRGGINSSFVAGNFEAVAAVRNLNPEMILYLSQVFVETSAEVGEASGAIGLECDVVANRSICCHAVLI